MNQLMDNEYTILYDQDSTINHHGLLVGSKTGTLDVKSSMLPLQTQNIADQASIEDDKLL